MVERVKTGGRWDPKEQMIYFIASGVDNLQAAADSQNYLLVAVNEIRSEKSLSQVNAWGAAGKTVFIDSGVFNLTNEHARNHGVKMNDALALAPEEIEGFDKLFGDYCRIVRTLEKTCWGYIEIDQGGRDNKIRTRERLESMGLRPIPVYHPLNDGWDYFDELAEKYDRICFGNVVQADRYTRKRLLATAWERRRRYPDLWIHLLGYTANEALNAFPINSCDSSTWLATVRWHKGLVPKTALKNYSHLGPEFRYNYDSPADAPDGHAKGIAMGAYEASMITRQWRAIEAEYRALGCDPGMYL